MSAHEEGSPGVGTLRVFEKARQRVVLFVIGRCRSRRTVLHPEMHQDCGDVIGQRSIILAHTAQRVSHDHVTEQRQRGAAPQRLLYQCAEEPGIVEHRIDALCTQLRFCVVGPTDAGTREEMHSELRIVTRERVANVREDHGTSSETNSVVRVQDCTPPVPPSAHNKLLFV
jgi:hypothetical protein